MFTENCWGEGGYLAFPDKFREELGEPKGKIGGEGVRLDRLYSYRFNTIKIGIKDIDGKKKCKDFDVFFVDDKAWKSAFQERLSSKREAFVGRELLFKLLVAITLDPKTLTSTIRLLEKG